MPDSLLAVFLGGGIGSVLRFAIGIFCKPFFSGFPVHTLLANILAAAVFAFIYFNPKLFHFFSQRQDLLLAGFCGGLSTFSAFSHETFVLFQEKKMMAGVLNIFLNVLICLLVFILFSAKKSGTPS
ncbi:MAG: CrcB family protein [Bacteroidia bacterium]|nr:CrcB family protein [Bacteroidia bacterium]